MSTKSWEDPVQAYYARIRHVANPAWPLEQTLYGTEEFGIIDCNGYTLAVAQAGRQRF